MVVVQQQLHRDTGTDSDSDLFQSMATNHSISLHVWMISTLNPSMDIGIDSLECEDENEDDDEAEVDQHEAEVDHDDDGVDLLPILLLLLLLLLPDAVDDLVHIGASSILLLLLLLDEVEDLAHIVASSILLLLDEVEDLLHIVASSLAFSTACKHHRRHRNKSDTKLVRKW